MGLCSPINILISAVILSKYLVFSVPIPSNRPSASSQQPSIAVTSQQSSSAKKNDYDIGVVIGTPAQGANLAPSISIPARPQQAGSGHQILQTRQQQPLTGPVLTIPLSKPTLAGSASASATNSQPRALSESSDTESKTKKLKSKAERDSIRTGLGRSSGSRSSGSGGGSSSEDDVSKYGVSGKRKALSGNEASTPIYPKQNNVTRVISLDTPKRHSMQTTLPLPAQSSNNYKNMAAQPVSTNSSQSTHSSPVRKLSETDLIKVMSNNHLDSIHDESLEFGLNPFKVKFIDLTMWSSGSINQTPTSGLSSGRFLVSVYDQNQWSTALISDLTPLQRQLSQVRSSQQLQISR